MDRLAIGGHRGAPKINISRSCLSFPEEIAPFPLIMLERWQSSMALRAKLYYFNVVGQSIGATFLVMLYVIFLFISLMHYYLASQCHISKYSLDCTLLI